MATTIFDTFVLDVGAHVNTNDGGEGVTATIVVNTDGEGGKNVSVTVPATRDDGVEDWSVAFTYTKGQPAMVDPFAHRWDSQPSLLGSHSRPVITGFTPVRPVNSYTPPGNTLAVTPDAHYVLPGVLEGHVAFDCMLGTYRGRISCEQP